MIYTPIRILHIHTCVQQEKSRKAFLEHCSRPQGRIIACQPQASAVEGEPAPRSVGSFGERVGQSWPVMASRPGEKSHAGEHWSSVTSGGDHDGSHGGPQPPTLGFAIMSEGKRYLLPL